MRLASFSLMLLIMGITIYRTAPWRRAGVAGPPLARMEPAKPADVVAKQPAPAADVSPDAPAGAATDETPASDATSPPESEAATAGKDDVSTDTANSAGDEQAQPVEAESGAATRDPHEYEAFERQPADDRDPRQMAAFRWEIREVDDRTLLIQGYELPAYRRLFRWISEQPIDELIARRPPFASYQKLHDHPSSYRGVLMSMVLQVRRVEKDEMTENHPVGFDKVYQLWGYPPSGRGLLYVVITPELPPGFPEGPDVNETVRVYGYFFKLQGYGSIAGDPPGRLQVAPLIIGRLDWQPTVNEMNPAEELLSYIVLGFGLVILAGVFGYSLVVRRRKKEARARESVWASLPDEHVDAIEGAGDPTWGDRSEEEPWREGGRENADWPRDA